MVKALAAGAYPTSRRRGVRIAPEHVEEMALILTCGPFKVLKPSEVGKAATGTVAVLYMLQTRLIWSRSAKRNFGYRDTVDGADQCASSSLLLL